ncbi:LuxR C-terminal-related transcriptional regulator [Streptomyces yaanensis]|uniref:LuxR C-terminal-related transcriptional regulator n=1 Tax=Streptomyces yaanensis TaxID=1142239 RepID=A0ABV7SH07_9ACTN|nr:response regulator transcription factor [Streptomyces sp. CGMCC 4.7035]WNB97915.1 response regulator transcription factor [Streptomyces sp. CGMCC 4.7035]
MSANPTYVAVISDSPLLRHGLSDVIDGAPDLERVTSVERVGVHCEAGDADVVLLGLQASVRDILGLISRLHQEGHRVVVVSHSKAQTDLVLCIEAGARGYLSQYIAEKELLTAVRTVAAGRSYFSTDFNNQGPQETPPHITDREREILQLVATGATDRKVASKLNISEHTVHSHLDRLRSKTGVRRRADLTRLALQRGVAGEPWEEG